MAIITRRPTTSGQRGLSVNKRDLTRKRPEKALVRPIQKHSGRDRFGHISIRHRGGGAKRKYRVLSTLEKGASTSATVMAIEYDPNRSADIALVMYDDDSRAYILATHDLKVGSTLLSGETAPIAVGNRLPLAKIPRGFDICDIAIDPNRPGQMVRAAGASAVIMAHEDDGRYAHVKLPSGEIRRFLTVAYATIGRVSNPDHNAVTIGKAGRMRHMGRRPQVLGKSMNPNDHPHGGGEGHSPIGLKHPKTPWGKPALGRKTRRNKHSNIFIIKSRHQGRRGK